MGKHSLEQPAYVESTLKQWGTVLPKSMIVLEYHGQGDPFFGGTADDRPLGADGMILTRTSKESPVEFDTIEAAHEAAKGVKNRRPDSILGVIPTWR